MSEASSALPGAEYDGYVRVREAGLCGMITLHGELSGARLKAAVRKLTGTDVPGPGLVSLKGVKGAAWMSPDEVLLLLPYDKAASGVVALDKALKGTHFLAQNVSDARAVFQISGRGAREVLAKLSPADLSPGGIRPGQIRRTRVAQVAAAFWMHDENSFELVCFRSVAEYVFGLLQHASRPGSEVDTP